MVSELTQAPMPLAWGQRSANMWYLPSVARRILPSQHIHWGFTVGVPVVSSSPLQVSRGSTALSPQAFVVGVQTIGVGLKSSVNVLAEAYPGHTMPAVRAEAANEILVMGGRARFAENRLSDTSHFLRLVPARAAHRGWSLTERIVRSNPPHWAVQTRG